MNALFRTTAIAAMLFAGVSALAPSTFAQEQVIAHAQGETRLDGVPSKVLVQDWAAFDNLVALGVPVAGVPSSNAPGYLQADIPGDALPLGSLFEPDFETIAAAEADVYVIGARSARVYDTAKDIVPTIDLSVNNASIIEGVEHNISLLGDIFDRKEKADELNAALSAKVAAVKAAAEGKGTALVLVTNAGKLGVYGPDSRISWIYNEIGMPSALPKVQDGDHGGDSVSFEFLLEANPDWVFVVDRDAGVGESSGAAQAVLDNELFNQTNAAKAGHVVYLDPQAAYITMNGYQGVMTMLDEVLDGFKS